MVNQPARAVISELSHSDTGCRVSVERDLASERAQQTIHMGVIARMGREARNTVVEDAARAIGERITAFNERLGNITCVACVQANSDK